MPEPKQGLLFFVRGKRLARQRIERKSPTLGAEAPSGATILFDGSSADGDKGRINNGLLANNDISTKQKFGSYQFYMEFRPPTNPLLAVKDVAIRVSIIKDALKRRS